MRSPLVRDLSAAAALLVALAACGGIAGGDRDATIASCKTLCAAQAGAPGCSRIATACDASCVADGMAFSEDCLVKAKAYFDCAAPLGYACPIRPDGAVAADSTCDARRHAYLLCKLTGQ